MDKIETQKQIIKYLQEQLEIQGELLEDIKKLGEE